jgi:hypothetical protein
MCRRWRLLRLLVRALLPQRWPRGSCGHDPLGRERMKDFYGDHCAAPFDCQNAIVGTAGPAIRDSAY